MPTIKSSADLRNGYNDISNFCHTFHEPVFITKNGKGDLAVMSIETYEKLLKLILKSPSRQYFEIEMMKDYREQVDLAIKYAEKVFGKDFPPY